MEDVPRDARQVPVDMIARRRSKPEVARPECRERHGAGLSSPLSRRPVNIRIDRSGNIKLKIGRAPPNVRTIGKTPSGVAPEAQGQHARADAQAACWGQGDLNTPVAYANEV
jgi:hypothetical protein